MILRYKIFLCVLVLVVPMFGCGKHIAYLKEVPVKYITETPASKPGRGEKIYVAEATDNRGDAQEMPGHVLFVPKQGNAFTSAVTDSIKDCLITYGYVVGSEKEADAGQTEQGLPARILYTSIDRLYCHRESGWVITDVGSSRLSFNIKEHGGTKPLWKDTVDKNAEVVSVMMATTGDTEDAINKAFAESMKEFESAISSPDFKNVLTGAPVSVEPVGAGN